MKEKPPYIAQEGFLQPTKEALKVEGRIIYQESAQAWNTIKLKREVLFLYPQLRDKRGQLKYTMIIPRSSQEIKSQINKLINTNKIPILLFLEKREIENNQS